MPLIANGHARQWSAERARLSKQLRHGGSSDACVMASVQRIVRCGLAVALAKGTATEQDFADALSYRTMTWGAEG